MNQNRNPYHGQYPYQNPNQNAYPEQYDDYQQPAYQNDGYQEQPAYPVQDDYQQTAYPTQPAPRRRPRTAPQRNWSAEPEHSVQQARPAQRNWSAEPEHSEPSAPSAPSVSSADTVQESTTTPPKITGEIVISAKNIHKTFGKGETAQVVLDGANLDIEKGSFVSLMGESGTGKSTLLYLIGGLDRDFTGDIFVSGKNIANLSDNQLSEIRCKKMGFVFQFYNLAANLTIEDNILLPLEMSGRKMADYREKYKEILEITGLENKVKSYPSQLSGGQQQRAAIARAVLGDPEIILADEPTGNLDAASGAEIMELFSRLNKERGVTILQVTHSAEAASYSSRIVTLKNRIITG